MKTLLLALFTAFVLSVSPVDANAQPVDIQDILATHEATIVKSSRLTVEPAIVALRDSGLPEAQMVLEAWQGKNLWQLEADKRFVTAKITPTKTYAIFDVISGEALGEVEKDAINQIKPNSGVRGLIGAALVRFQLMDPDIEKRRDALVAIGRDSTAYHLPAIRGAIDGETDPAIKVEKIRLERLLAVQYESDVQLRVAAIKSLKGDLGVDARAALNPILQTSLLAVLGEPIGNVARTLKVDTDIRPNEAYALLIEENLALPIPTHKEIRAALEENIVDGFVAGVPTYTLDTDVAREAAYSTLAEQGLVAPLISTAAQRASIAAHIYYEIYTEPNAEVTTAARETLDAIEVKVGISQAVDLTLDGLSLASIYFLAAIGLAITFGVMGVINMAHGEFIMMGAYTGYVVQQIVPNYTLSLIIALPAAFLVTFAAGVAMERLVIRWLYNRPLETLLATFGISVALQQLAKNIFGTQARPLTSPAWLDGALSINDVVSISYIRIAIFVLALIFLMLFLFIMKKTRVGLEVRAVTQNPRMASSMGINPDRINMLTFGLGSGIAGIAGVAIGLFAKVTSEIGNDYIVQSFMTVVVGGVGNIWGTLAGALMIGGLQKSIEWFNPSNTLAAQTYMIIFIIIFIQFRPKGIIALKGRAAGD
ncbi:urea ABC transporter permease subunit UrtB [Falsihalocynthiibacter arcticus]|uniref:Branched-chain amino acid ABC transporter permease n=1 Tax=Falsihalocynthiibacter arcticus TaxID=1579316 RepID=A0A126UZM2_9RHOB|nr:urea ABC transporter permease subunit UrtB [Falsihalocynthiibacter arcticus]AML51337.1 branched-chain amino acid ABC transporter permease [Falsihalocynthiibacter arcticus]